MGSKCGLNGIKNSNFGCEMKVFLIMNLNDGFTQDSQLCSLQSQRPNSLDSGISSGQ